jgi:hypothetical protein
MNVIASSALLLAVAACVSTRSEAPTQPPPPPAPTTAPPAAPEADAASPSAARCTRDEDCQAVSFMCTGCDCIPMAKGADPPKCEGRGVACFVDPCMTKRAACREGACAIVDAAGSVRSAPDGGR